MLVGVGPKSLVTPHAAAICFEPQPRTLWVRYTMKIGQSLRTIFVEPLELFVGLPAGEAVPQPATVLETRTGGDLAAQAMNIPDYVRPMVGWRVWKLHPSGLRSLNGEPWVPAEPLAAACKLLGGRPAMAAHPAPARECRCGVYAAKSFAELRRTGYDRYGVHGEVCLWGTVVEHETGWRGEYAYPKRLVLPLNLLPRDMGRRQRLLKMLTAYGSEIALAAKQGTVPLWDKCSGLNASAVDLLVEQCQNWYEGRRQRRQIQPGDRLALLSRGIGVVKRVAGECVYAQLEGRSILKTERRHIAWHGGNMRWEANCSEVTNA